MIYNVFFDVGFMDYEFLFLKNLLLKMVEMCIVIDSFVMACKMYFGKWNNLDVFCDCLGIDNSKCVFYGVLLDVEILVDVFLMMIGG